MLGATTARTSPSASTARLVASSSPTGEWTNRPPWPSLTTVIRVPHSTPKNFPSRASTQTSFANGVSMRATIHGIGLSRAGASTRGRRRGLSAAAVAEDSPRVAGSGEMVWHGSILCDGMTF